MHEHMPCARTYVGMYVHTYVCMHVFIDCWYSPDTPECSLPKIHTKNAALKMYNLHMHIPVKTTHA